MSAGGARSPDTRTVARLERFSGNQRSLGGMFNVG